MTCPKCGRGKLILLETTATTRGYRCPACGDYIVVDGGAETMPTVSKPENKPE